VSFGAGTNVSLRNGGKITGGTVGQSGNSLSIVNAALDGASLAANVAVPAGATVTVTNGLNLVGGATVSLQNTNSNPNQGTSVLPALSFSGSTQTLGGAGVVVFDGGNAGRAGVQPTSGGSLTIGPDVTIRTGAGSGFVGANLRTTTNLGTLSAQTIGQAIKLSGTINNQGTIEARNGGTIIPGTGLLLANYGGGTLTGGAWAAYANSSLAPSMGDITVNAADITLSGSGSEFAPVGTLADNRGAFALLGGRDFATVGSLGNTGRLLAGVGSDLTVNGGLTLGDDATLALELQNDASVEGYGQVVVSGLASIDGAVQALFPAGHDVHAGDAFTILSADSIGGTFDELLLPAGVGGELLYTPASVQLLVTAVPEPTATVPLLALTLLAGRRRRAANHSLGAVL